MAMSHQGDTTERHTQPSKGSEVSSNDASRDGKICWKLWALQRGKLWHQEFNEIGKTESFNLSII
jgi:hypothetical protein